MPAASEPASPRLGVECEPGHYPPDSHRTIARVSWRVLPLLGAAYLVAYLDRVNISFAALQMNADLGFNATTYGMAGGLFFLESVMNLG